MEEKVREFAVISQYTASAVCKIHNKKQTIINVILDDKLTYEEQVNKIIRALLVMQEDLSQNTIDTTSYFSKLFQNKTIGSIGVLDVEIIENASYSLKRIGEAHSEFRSLRSEIREVLKSSMTAEQQIKQISKLLI